MSTSTSPIVQIGECFTGDGVNAAHINCVLGDRTGPAGTAWATALATPSTGHVPFVACMRPSLSVQPATLIVTKAAPVSDEHGRFLWGAVQSGIAGGVADALADGVIAPETVNDLVLIAAVWLNPGADDEHEVYRNNREAMIGALRNGAAGLPSVEDVMAARDDIHNPFYDARTS